MKQILQSLKDGTIELATLPVPAVKSGHLLIASRKTLISLGTERMLLQFGRAGWIEKARQQPDKVKQVVRKLKTDGVMPTMQAVFNKLDQPLPLGYCNAGVVLEVGKGVNGFKVGDRVVSNGNHAEVVCIPQHLCAKIPESVDDETAAFTVLASIALQGIRLIEPTLGEKVAVMGLGLIGLLGGQILRANGCRVIGYDLDPEKVALAKTYGIEAYCLGGGIDPVEIALQMTGGNGVDAVLITAATKSNEPIHQAPQMCRKRGRVVLVGVIGLELSRDDFYKKEISFQVSCSYGPGRYDPAYEKKGLDYPIGFVRWTEQRNFEAILDLMADGRLTCKELISKIVPIAEAVAAYDLVEKGDRILGLLLDYPARVDLGARAVRLDGADLETPVNAAPAEPVIGLIGAGGFAGSTLLPAFEAAGAKLKTIASAGGVSSTHFGKKYKFVISSTDHSLILKDQEINTVVISTQHNLHAGFVLEALKAGKHVFVEKPLCLTRAELAEISKVYEEVAKPAGRLLMIGFNRRFAPLVQTMKRLLDDCVGPRAVTMTVNAGAIPADHWTQDGEAGGGRLLGEACHFIDLIRFLVGKPIEVVQALRGTGAAPDAPPDNGVISMRFVDGSLGTVQYFSCGHKDFPKERLEVFCGGKILQLDNFRRLDGFGWPGFSGEKPWSQDKGHNGEIAAFLAAIREGKPCPIPFAEQIEVTEATFAAAGISDGEGED